MHEHADLGRALSADLKLIEGRNVILSLSDDIGEPYLWGFPTIETWRTFLKMCLRFDDALGVSHD